MDRHEEHVNWLIKQFMPSGCGCDSGTKLLECNEKRMVFQCDYHHMNDGGYYDGWTEHTVIVKPSWDGVDIRITGRNRNDIKEHLHEMFHCALNETCRRMTENGYEWGWETINTSGTHISYDWHKREEG
jgi:hypothetical protein